MTVAALEPLVGSRGVARVYDVSFEDGEAWRHDFALTYNKVV